MAKNVNLKDLLQEEGLVEKLSEVTFEQGLKLLEELVQSVESGTLPLDTAVTSYERGSQLVEHLRGLLSGAEEKLRVIGKRAEER